MAAVKVQWVAATFFAVVSAIATVALIGATMLMHWYYAPAAAVWAAITYWLLTESERLYG